MQLRVNGEPIPLAFGGDDSIGQVLSRADEVLEQTGSVIVGLSLDGQNVDPESFPTLRDRSISEAGIIDIIAQSSSDYRAKAIDLFLDLLAIGARAVKGEDELWAAFLDNVTEFVKDLSGLFPADELSFLKDFEDTLATSLGEGLPPATAQRSAVALRIEGLGTFFRERLAELRDPVSETRRTASLYVAEAEELRELPVRLQTGKESEAMRTIVMFIEIFNKVIRLIPELRKRGIDTDMIRIDDLGLEAFHVAFNEILRGFSKAIEDRDSVLIGDLAEYELAPRMGSLFSALKEALPQ
ncbi:MAG: hypothetical protein WCQ50_01650 [Spirochaetota bacterium]